MTVVVFEAKLLLRRKGFNPIISVDVIESFERRGSNAYPETQVMDTK